MEFTNGGKDVGRQSVDSTSPSWELFDSQATVFERRAGLPVEYCRAIADAVVEIGGVDSGDLIVEVGPGTGQIGQWFGAPLRYVGLDKSAGMLREFRSRLSGPVAGRVLVRADADATWPLADGVARVIFSSRALHLLNREHVASEAFRVASPGGATLVIGRVERDPDSVRARMAREMNNGLRRHGFEGRRGDGRNQKLLESCCLRGAEMLEPITVASWKVLASPRLSLDSWRCLTGLGGVPVPADIKDEILTELEVWAEEAFGGLDRQFESEEKYMLRPARIRQAHSG